HPGRTHLHSDRRGGTRRSPSSPSRSHPLPEARARSHLGRLVKWVRKCPRLLLKHCSNPEVVQHHADNIKNGKWKGYRQFRERFYHFGLTRNVSLFTRSMVAGFVLRSLLKEVLGTLFVLAILGVPHIVMSASWQRFRSKMTRRPIRPESGPSDGTSPPRGQGATLPHAGSPDSPVRILERRWVLQLAPLP